VTSVTYDEFDHFCAALPATSRVVQWGGAQVWKVGGKMFAVGGWEEGIPAFTFKASPLSFEILQALPGLRPAPYLASRGLKWIQHFAAPGLADNELRDYLGQSHRLVALGFSGKRRRELGIK